MWRAKILWLGDRLLMPMGIVIQSVSPCVLPHMATVRIVSLYWLVRVDPAVTRHQPILAKHYDRNRLSLHPDPLEADNLHKKARFYQCRIQPHLWDNTGSEPESNEMLLPKSEIPLHLGDTSVEDLNLVSPSENLNCTMNNDLGWKHPWNRISTDGIWSIL